MRTMSATEARQNLGALLDHAQSEPVMIRRQNRDIAGVLSAREYDRMRARSSVFATGSVSAPCLPTPDRV